MVAGASSTFSSFFPHPCAVVDVETSGLARRRDRVLTARRDDQGISGLTRPSVTAT
ncbi:hypothetical protein FRACA_80060 [Frankia canadensis]|uniref:Uncharacterized protein n=1 Tax=Frankia canadensis TaxID=1836972 RepID=A0A2I2L1G6_9ACTN|nr:hypothetical protein FRACA_80060 [Frankia canadensis]SOU59050.1 hypothetical protein FRACA_80060 [Frankia canadensis]